MEATPAIDWSVCPETRPFPGVSARRRDTDQMTLVRYEFEAGSGYPDHSHPEEQVVIMLSGEASFRVAGREVRLRAGDLLPTPGGVAHGCTAGPAGACFINVVVPRRS